MEHLTPIESKNGMPAKMTSHDGRLVINFTGWEEPNNGRILWSVDVNLDGVAINGQLFSSGWNFLNDSINQLMLADRTGTHYYIPTEGMGHLWDDKDATAISIAARATGRGRFLGNRFAYGHLLIIWSDLLVLTCLKTYRSKSFRKTIEGHFISADLIASDMIRLSFYNIVDKRRIEDKILISVAEFE